MGRKKRVGVLISGNGSNLQALIDACRAPDYPAEISCVISNNPQAYGLERARKAGIAAHAMDHRAFPSRAAFDGALHETLTGENVEFLCLAGFMRLLTPEFVTKWQGRIINIHPSLLPAFKGAHAQRGALAGGVKISGCTVHFVVPEMDAGPIIAQESVPVYDDDTEQTLTARIMEKEHLCYVRALRLTAEDKIRIQGNRTVVLE